jgi:signal transduction histidine kinase
VISLRSFSRLDEADMKPVDIHEGIDSTLLILQRRLKARPGHPGIEVVKNYGELPLVECYPKQLNQVFLNLLSNAIDALEERMKEDEKGKNEISLSAFSPQPFAIALTTQILSPTQVQIEISDNGIGMTPEVKNHIFEPFFTTKQVGKGTGLGLSTCYQIVVENHQGQLICLSQPGLGATFQIVIPLRQSGHRETSGYTGSFNVN